MAARYAMNAIPGRGRMKRINSNVQIVDWQCLFSSLLVEQNDERESCLTSRPSTSTAHLTASGTRTGRIVA